MSTKNAKPQTGKTESKKETATMAVAKPQKAVNQKKDVFGDLMKHLNEMELLRDYYNKLKIKKDTLQTAYDKMIRYEAEKQDHFEEGSKKQFPFEIVVRGEGEHGRPDDIFTINKAHTVTNFSKYLLNEINQLLEVFEADIVDHSKKLK